MSTKSNKLFSFGSKSKDTSRVEGRKKSLFAVNGLAPIEEGTDGNSESSVASDRKVIRRSSIICSEGFDKYTYDCSRNDIPFRSVGLELDGDFVHPAAGSDVSSLSDQTSLYSDGEISPKCSLIKRNSVVHPGSIDREHSYEDDVSAQNLRIKGSSLAHPGSIDAHQPFKGETSSKSSLVKRNSLVHPDNVRPFESEVSSKFSLIKRNSLVHPDQFQELLERSGGRVQQPLKAEASPKGSCIKRNSVVHPDQFQQLLERSGGRVQQPLKSETSPKGSCIKRNSVVHPDQFEQLLERSGGREHQPLKAETSPKGSCIKRNSVVHPGNTDLQRSLCINGKFQNPWPTWRPPTVTNILKFGLSKDKSKVPSKQELDLVLPIIKPQFSKNCKPPEDGVRITWIGHSTVLVQMHGLNILTDPIFSDRASPSQVVGPKRYRNPPCTIHDLPHINAVVISHSHYDHLDLNTVILLNARFGTDIRWFVPLGLLPWMQHAGCENVVELDWWEENCVPEHSDTFFTFTPAQHWSKRTITDDNKVLWGSWCIIGPKYRFFFAGDTGYCDVFKQIGKVHGPFDVSAIPIGAFEPRWFMKYQHVDPEEAVKIHIDVKSKYTVAVHWGTFCLANEYYLDPPVKLREGLEKYNIPTDRFFTMKHGESRVVANDSIIKREPTKSHFRWS